MGLNISAYSNIRFLHNNIGDSKGAYLYVNEHFKDRADGLVDGYYDFDEEYYFRAGSYSGHSKCRELAAKALGFTVIEEYWDECTPETPLYDLLNFSDCEGTIGPLCAKRLYESITKHKTRILERVGENQYFLGWLEDFQRAAKLAMQNGAISFS